MSGLLLQDIRLSLSLEQGEERVLVEIDKLAIRKGETVTIMGRSGSGKSALLSYICGVLPKADKNGGFMSQGRVFLNGEDITHKPPHTRKLGILFQSPLLFPHLTIAQNLAFGIPARVKTAERHSKIRNALAVAGLPDYAERYESMLSGGEKARIALMRVLLSEPQALLLDEPFSALDAELRQSFRQFTRQNAEDYGLPVLLVTHDKEDAVAFGNEILKIGD